MGVASGGPKSPSCPCTRVTLPLCRPAPDHNLSQPPISLLGKRGCSPLTWHRCSFSSPHPARGHPFPRSLVQQVVTSREQQPVISPAAETPGEGLALTDCWLVPLATQGPVPWPSPISTLSGGPYRYRPPTSRDGHSLPLQNRWQDGGPMAQRRTPDAYLRGRMVFSSQQISRYISELGSTDSAGSARCACYTELLCVVHRRPMGQRSTQHLPVRAHTRISVRNRQARQLRVPALEL